MADAAHWYWCLEHDRPEIEAKMCRAAGRLGPYDSEAAARAWKATVEDRNDDWDEEDEEWDAWPGEKPTDS